METMVIQEGVYTPDVHKMLKLSKENKESYIKEMIEYAKNFLKMHFGLELEIPIRINARLTRVSGYFEHTAKKALGICMSEKFIALALLDEEDGLHSVLDVLAHELIHYALFILGEDNRDGSVSFEKKLAELGIRSSGVTKEEKRFNHSLSVYYDLVDIFEGSDLYWKHTKNGYKGRVGYKIIKFYG